MHMLSSVPTHLQIQTEIPITLHSRRDLTIYLSSIWQQYFSDIPHANEVQIGYCRPWKSRLVRTHATFSGMERCGS